MTFDAPPRVAGTALDDGPGDVPGLEGLPARQANLEGLDDFAVEWGWADVEHVEPGFTAVLRVKNEAASLPWVLPPLLDAVHRVVVVDNDSSDGTPDVARATATQVGAADRLDVVAYPFSVSRCGPEHLETPPDSVHSLTYFYNWAFAHVRTSYAIKWDGDMVLTGAGVQAMRDLAWQLENVRRIITMRRYPLYVGDDRTGFLDISVVNREPWGWPNIPEIRHIKAFEWELPRWPDDTPRISLPDWTCIELKHLDVDEFAHWSVEDFSATNRTARKQREWEVFHVLSGRADPPLGVVRIDAPEGRHIVDHVRRTWLPEHREQLAREHKQVLWQLAVGTGRAGQLARRAGQLRSRLSRLRSAPR